MTTGKVETRFIASERFHFLHLSRLKDPIPFSGLKQRTGILTAEC